MKKYLIGIILMLLVFGCSEQQPVENNEEVISEPEEDVPPLQVEAPPIPTEVDTPPVPDVTEEIPVGDTVRILGKEGIDPEELSVKAGTKVEFVNEDPDKKVIVLVFQKLGTRNFVNSDHMEPSQTYEHTFEEPGVYEYWSLAYGIHAKVIVE